MFRSSLRPSAWPSPLRRHPSDALSGSFGRAQVVRRAGLFVCGGCDVE